MASRNWDSLDLEQQFLIVTSDIEELLKEINVLTSQGGEVDTAVNNALDSFIPILRSCGVDERDLQSIELPDVLKYSVQENEILEHESLSRRRESSNLELGKSKTFHENETREKLNDGSVIKHASETLESVTTRLQAQSSEMKPESSKLLFKLPEKKQTETIKERRQEKKQSSEQSGNKGKSGKMETGKRRSMRESINIERSKVSMTQVLAAANIEEQPVQPEYSGVKTRTSSRTKNNSQSTSRVKAGGEEEEESVYETLTHYNLRHQSSHDYSKTY